MLTQRRTLEANARSEQMRAAASFLAAPFTAPGGALPSCIHELIAARALAAPESAAVFGAGRTPYTFAELFAQAGAVAAFLRGQGVGADKVVAVALPQGFTMVAAMLGVMMSGGAYVYIDPAYPLAHTEFLLGDSAAVVVLADESTQASIPGTFRHRVKLLSECSPLNREGALQAAAAAASPRPSACARELMAILYTSGSTGKPKGVALEHRSTVMHVSLPVFEAITAADRFAQCSNPGFIGSMADMWLPLTRGAATAFIPRSTLLDPAAFAQEVSALRLTAAFLTPKVAEMYSDTAPECLGGLRNVFMAGEMARADAINRLASRPGAPNIFNLYGTTEHNGGISAFQVPRDPGQQPRERIPAGLPFGHVKVLLLDKELNPVAAGEAGEIFIASPQLARGYLNRPDATNERFVVVDGVRAYRTGDMGRWLPTGELEVLGRAEGLDTMVKVGGNRVELSQLEAAAVQAGQGQVAAAVATLHGAARLALYYVPAAGAAMSPRELKAALTALLPDYMLPSYVAPIEKVPLNFNGKVDRGALPAPSTEAAETEGPAVEGELQRVIAEAMEEVLGLPAGTVKRDTSYAMHLGGTSFHAMGLLMQLRKKVCPALAIVHLHPEKDTPALIAETILQLNDGEGAGVEAGGGAAAGAALPEELALISRGGPEAAGRAPVFVVHGGNGNSPFGMNMAAAMTARPLYAIQLTEHAVARANAHPEGFVMGLAAYYVDCVKAVQKEGPYTLGGAGSGATIAFEMGRELEARGDKVDALVVLDSWLPGGNDKNYRVHGLAPDVDPDMLLVTEMTRSARVPPAAVELGRFRAQLDEAISKEKVDPAAAFKLRMEAMVGVMGKALGPEVARTLRTALTNLRPLFSAHAVTGRRGGAKLHAPIVIARADDDTFVVEMLRRAGRDADIADYGWGCATTEGVTTVRVPGNHVNLTVLEEGSRKLAELFGSLGTAPASAEVCPKVAARRPDPAGARRSRHPEAALLPGVPRAHPAEGLATRFTARAPRFLRRSPPDSGTASRLS